MATHPALSLTSLSDTSLVTIANSQGKLAEKAVLALIARYRPLLHKVVRKFLFCGADRRDLEQSAIQGLIESIRNFNPTTRETLIGYAYKYVFGRARQCAEIHLRAEKERKSLSVDTEGEASDNNEAYHASDEFSMASEQFSLELSMRNLAVDIENFRETLGPRQRQLFDLIYSQGVTPGQAIKMMGISSARYYQLLAVVKVRARKELEL